MEETGAKVIAVIFDGASVNRKFLTMNSNFGNTKFVHVTMNVASGDSRPLYFMVDPPHLMKTFRNCLANSYSHRRSRTLWKNGQPLSWEAIEALYKITKNDKFKTTKLTKAHVRLSSFSCMKVILACQVLSNSVAEALLRNKEHPLLKEVFSQELVDFLRIMNRTFDCLNGGVHSTKKNINSDLNEYFSLDDPRFQFLQETVLTYLEDWENDVLKRKGFTKEQKLKMMISFQSMEALKITLHSFVQVTKFLIMNGAPSVSSRNMNQDPLEQYFSILRRCGGSNENPTLKGVLHSRQSLHVQGSTFLAGGSRGNTEVLKRQLEIDETPLPSRKKSQK
ncbi:Transposable element P transposase [Frankliniella fusca]|uniref:Transposable element P transposase n=1 Tax=Frankliniella fusca TaxID=407009 RepID=A0AAE1GY55_9NEOP|nr:Transposable element P transposase [Frankliniella fusca]